MTGPCIGPSRTSGRRGCLRSTDRAARVSALAAAALFCVLLPARPALAEDGAIVGWGAQVVVPQSELTDLVAVAAGFYHSLGLKADGSIVA